MRPQALSRNKWVDEDTRSHSIDSEVGIRKAHPGICEAKNVTVYILFGIIYIDCSVKGIFQKDRKAVQKHSPPI